MNYYEQAIDILEDSSLDPRAILVEVAKKRPKALIDAAVITGYKTSAAWKKEAHRLYVVCGKKIDAIKYCRAETGMDLKQAKEAVEALE